jgi:hypothetical protein
MRVLFRILLLLAAGVGRVAAAQPENAAALCESAVTGAEAAGRLPAGLLGAIAVTESGRLNLAAGRLRPWPWTINAGGEGQFFASKQQAVAAVQALQARGVRSIDVGCLQINLLHHPAAFASLEQAFDPRMNAAYATKFLNALYFGGRDWPRAIAAYHSETPELGTAYRVLVMARWQQPDFTKLMRAGPVYGDFAGREVAYAAFAPLSRVYGAFARPR